MKDIIGETFGDYTVLSYEGRERKSSGGYKHWYIIEFPATKNQYIEERTRIRQGKCKDLKQIKIESSLAKREKIKQQTRLSKKTYRRLKRFDFDYKTVMALDLSTTATGICISRASGMVYHLIIFEDRLKKVDYFRDNYTVLPSEPDMRLRCFEIFKNLLDYIKQVDIIILEDTYPSAKNIEVSNKLSELRGFVMAAIMLHGKEFEIVSPSTWKNYYPLGKKRDEQKINSVKIARKLLADDSIVSNDIADATLLLNWTLNNLREGGL